jgi:hypothetical protein
MIYDRPYIVLRCPYCYFDTLGIKELRHHMSIRHNTYGSRNRQATAIERLQNVEIYDADTYIAFQLIKKYNQKQTARGNVKKRITF